VPLVGERGRGLRESALESLGPPCPDEAGEVRGRDGDATLLDGFGIAGTAALRRTPAALGFAWIDDRALVDPDLRLGWNTGVRRP